MSVGDSVGEGVWECGCLVERGALGVLVRIKMLWLYVCMSVLLTPQDGRGDAMSKGSSTRAVVFVKQDLVQVILPSLSSRRGHGMWSRWPRVDWCTVEEGCLPFP